MLDKKIGLVVSGPISFNEFEKVRFDLAKVGLIVNRKLTLSVDVGEVVQLAFQNLDFYTLVRNGILFTLLIDSVKKIFQCFRKNIDEKRQPKSIWIPIIFEKEGKTLLSVNIIANEKTLPILIEELQKRFSEDFIKNIKKQEMWAMQWDEKKNEVKIFEI